MAVVMLPKMKEKCSTCIHKLDKNALHFILSSSLAIHAKRYTLY